MNKWKKGNLMFLLKKFKVPLRDLNSSILRAAQGKNAIIPPSAIPTG
jgi:hypothetical protein